MEAYVNFPKDADGDVLHRLEESGLDFSQPQPVDFNVDFGSWPPPIEALEKLKASVGSFEVYEPEEGYEGYVLFTLKELLSYELVVGTQDKITKLMSECDGVCESWGVLH